MRGIVLNSFTKNCDQSESTVPSNARFLPQFELPHGWQHGGWSNRTGKLKLSYDGQEEVCTRNMYNGQEIFRSEEHTYYLVADKAMQLEAISFITEMKNHGQMMNNLLKERIRVNDVFGKGVVYKNFNEHEPIEI
jgi:hypothetical protein